MASIIDSTVTILLAPVAVVKESAVQCGTCKVCKVENVL